MTEIAKPGESGTGPITGRTRLYGILADPIAHVKTPQVMHALFAEHGIDGVLVPFHVKPNGLADALEGLRCIENFGGFVVTVPHKPAMLTLCDRVSNHARLVGAVNCVRREADGAMVGEILDGIGFVEGLQASGFDLVGKRAFLAGAGGAASAIAFALADAGIEALTITNRTQAKADDLAARVCAAYPALSVQGGKTALDKADLVVNGTVLGMMPDDPLPLDTERLHAGQMAAEVIMEPAQTAFLRAAREQGCRVHPGLPMLRSQIRLMARHMEAL